MFRTNHPLAPVLARAFIEAVRFGANNVVQHVSRERWSQALKAARWDPVERTLQFDDS